MSSEQWYNALSISKYWISGKKHSCGALLYYFHLFKQISIPPKTFHLKNELFKVLKQVCGFHSNYAYKVIDFVRTNGSTNTLALLLFRQTSCKCLSMCMCVYIHNHAYKCRANFLKKILKLKVLSKYDLLCI